MSDDFEIIDNQLKSLIRVSKIQLDLFNNAIIFLNKKVLAENLESLKEVLLHRLKKKFIHEILFINPKYKIKRKCKENGLLQKEITDFIQSNTELSYTDKLIKTIFFKNTLNKSIQISLNNQIVPDMSKTIQYRGNKSQISEFLIPHFEVGTTVLDLMAGSQNVSLILKQQSKIFSNDVQYYSYVLGKAYIENNKYTLLNIIPKELIKSDPSFTLFQKYYSDVYFTFNQCVEIDNIRASIERIKKLNNILYYCYLSCLLQSLDMIARTAGHFDGALDKNTIKAKKRETKSVYEEFCRRIKSFRTYKSNFKNGIYNLTAEEI